MKPGTVVYIDNPSTLEVEAGRSQVQGHLQLHTEFEVRLDYETLLQNQTSPCMDQTGNIRKAGEAEVQGKGETVPQGKLV